MGRALIIVGADADRDKAALWARKAPAGTRITFQHSKRTLPQNSRLWAMLTDVAAQATHNGRHYTTDQWKALFMHACGRAVQFLPSLDGSTFIPWGGHSSDLSKDEMSELIDFMESWSAEHGVVLHDDKADAA